MEFQLIQISDPNIDDFKFTIKQYFFKTNNYKV